MSSWYLSHTTPNWSQTVHVLLVSVSHTIPHWSPDGTCPLGICHTQHLTDHRRYMSPWSLSHTTPHWSQTVHVPMVSVTHNTSLITDGTCPLGICHTQHLTDHQTVHVLLVFDKHISTSIFPWLISNVPQLMLPYALLCLLQVLIKYFWHDNKCHNIHLVPVRHTPLLPSDLCSELEMSIPKRCHGATIKHF